VAPVVLDWLRGDLEMLVMVMLMVVGRPWSTFGRRAMFVLAMVVVVVMRPPVLTGRAGKRRPPFVSGRQARGAPPPRSHIDIRRTVLGLTRLIGKSARCRIPMMRPITVTVAVREATTHIPIAVERGHGQLWRMIDRLRRAGGETQWTGRSGGMRVSNGWQRWRSMSTSTAPARVVGMSMRMLHRSRRTVVDLPPPRRTGGRAGRLRRRRRVRLGRVR